MFGRWVALSLSLMVGMLLGTTRAFSSSFESVSDQALVCETTEIVRGEVIDVQSAWDASHVAIWTTATVRVEDAIRGGLAPGAVVHVKEVGGTVEDYTIEATDFPTFRKDEEVVLLLRPWEDESGQPAAEYRVWGFGRGMFVVGPRQNRQPTVSRYDVARSGRATMFTDRIPPTSVLEALKHELGRLASRCGQGGPKE